MARTPAEGPGHRAHQSPSPAGRATGARIVIVLTASAELHAGRHGLAGALSSLALGSDCAAGDIVSVTRAGERHDFAVLRRRWIAGEKSVTLELTLDYPARGGGAINSAR